MTNGVLKHTDAKPHLQVSALDVSCVQPRPGIIIHKWSLVCIIRVIKNVNYIDLFIKETLFDGTHYSMIGY